MKFGVREVANMTFTKLSGVGPTSFTIDTAKTSTIDSTSGVVYATGGRGNARLMAWEGDKVLTFVVEDALLTLDSFHALTGATEDTTTDTTKTIYNIYPTSFAGFYSVVADTLFRKEDGVDHAARITIPRAKLQTTLNLPMANSGDPAAFTFTFDALPSLNPTDNKLLCSIAINNAGTDETGEKCVMIEGLAPIYTTKNKLVVKDKVLKLRQDSATATEETITTTAINSALNTTGAIVTDLATHTTAATTTEYVFTLTAGCNYFYII